MGHTTADIGDLKSGSTPVLTVGVSSRALFDLDEAQKVFEKKGLAAYIAHQRKRESVPLEPGPAFPLIRALLRLNTLIEGRRFCSVAVISGAHPDTGLRILKSIDHYGLDIDRAAFTGGAPTTPYLRAYNIGLMLSRSRSDAQEAIDAGIAGAQLQPHLADASREDSQIRIAFDGDAVLFSEEAERIFQQHGLDAFSAHERINAHTPLMEGPFAGFLKGLHDIQMAFPPENRPIRLALVTARGAPAHERALRTLRAWGIGIDEAFFLQGLSKREIIRAFDPHIFFDDQEKHIQSAADLAPSGSVPWPSVPKPIMIPSEILAIQEPTSVA